MIHIWFNLMMFHHGHVFLMQTFEMYDDCLKEQRQYEERYPDRAFSCPYVRVESV